MKRVLLSVLEHLGYVVIRVDDWSALQRRVIQAETAIAQSSPCPAPGSHPPDDAQLRRLREQAGECARERDIAIEGKNRALRRVQAWKRYCTRLVRELKSCKDQLARGDHAGHIRVLQEENGKLSRRLSDLETYLDQTRGTRKPYYL
jgi:hypothetical protein